MLPLVLGAKKILAGLGFAWSVAILCAAGFLFQTVQLDGFKLWFVEVEGCRPKNERLAGEIAALIEAQDDAAAAQRALIEQKERQYEQGKQQTDALLQALENQGDRLVADFIAAGGVRPAASGGPSRGSGGAATGGDTGGSIGAGSVPVLADGLVRVTPRDIEVCTENTRRILSIHREWVPSLLAE